MFISRCRWEDIGKMDLKVVVCEDVYKIQLAQDMAHWWVLVNKVIEP
jgi:hypothetical protein